MTTNGSSLYCKVKYLLYVTIMFIVGALFSKKCLVYNVNLGTLQIIQTLAHIHSWPVQGAILMI